MEEQAKKEKAKKGRRSFLRWALALLFLVALLWGAYAFTGYYLRTNISKEVYERSQGIYTVEFSNFELLGLEMGFRLTGFKLIPDIELYQKKLKSGEVKTSLYEITIPKCELRGLNFFEVFLSPGIELQELVISNPEVRILAHIDSSSNEGSKEYDDIGPIVRNLMQYLLIDHVRIDEGIFDLFVDKEERIESFTASKISLDLQGFKVDNAEGFGSKNFLYSKDYYIHLQDYKLNLSDGVHTLEANEIEFSSQDSSIFARGFNLSPGQKHPDSLFELEKPYYHFFFPELSVKGADIQAAYLTDTVGIRLVHLQRPNFQIFNIRKEKDPATKKEFSGFAQNIYPLVQGYFKEVLIDSVLIGDGTFDFYEPFEEYPENIEIEGIHVALEQFKLDSTAYLEEDNLLYAKEFWLDFESFRMDLKDSIHEIKADSLFVSSKLQAIRAEGLTLNPRNEVNYSMNYVDLKIPAIVIEGIDLIKAYHKNVLTASLFDLEDPVIKANIGRAKKRKIKRADEAKPDFVHLVSKYFDTVAVSRIQLDNGLVDFSFLQNGRRESVFGDQINIVLTGFEIDSMAAHRRNRIFFSKQLDLEIHDYDFLLDQLHEVKVKKMTVSTRKSLIDFQDIVFAPRDTTNVLDKLKELGQTTIFDLHIPRLRWEGVDLFKLIFQDALIARRIHMIDPVYNFSVYPQRRKQTEIRPILEKDLKDIITQFVNRVQVGELFAENAIVHVSIEPHRDDQFWTRAPLDFKLIDYRLDKYTPVDQSRFFFASDLQLTLTDYDMDFGTPGHTMFAKKVFLSSREKRLIGEGIKIVPKKYRGGLFPFKMKFKADFPKIEATGLDLKVLIMERKLVIKDLIADRPELEYHQTKGFFNQSPPQAGKGKKGLKGVSIERFLTRNGKISLYDENGRKFMGSDFEGPIKYFAADDYSTGPSPTRFLTRQIGLKFTNGFFLFPDGLHKAVWDKLSIDQGNAEINLYEGKLVALPGADPYRTLSRTQKSAYRSGSIKKLTISGFDIDEFYRTGLVEIDRVTLNDMGLIEFVFPQLRKKSTLNLSAIRIKLPKGITGIDIRTVAIKNFHFLRYNVQEDSLDLVLDQGRIYGKASGIRIRDGDRWNDNRIGFADDITLLVRNFNRKIPGALMDINAKEVGISTGRKEAFVYDFHVKPWYGKYLHSRKLGYQADRTEVKIKKIFLKDFDLIKLYHDQYLQSRKLLVDGLWVSDYRDKRVPERKDFYPPMPQEILKKMEFRFNLDTVEVQNGEINYEEFVPDGKVAGMITFSDFSAVASNVTSDPDIYRQDPYLKTFGKAELMGEGLINFNCDLNVRDPGNKFEMWGSVGQMDMRKINPMVENVAFTTIKSGYIKSILFEAQADDHFSTGTMKFRYNDFKIALINKNTGQVEGIDKGFVSFLANTFVVNTKNPHLGFFREGSIFFKRLPNKSIINYWWKSIYTGIKTSIGAQNERKLHKIAEKSDD